MFSGHAASMRGQSFEGPSSVWFRWLWPVCSVKMVIMVRLYTCWFSTWVCVRNSPLCTCWFSACVCVRNGPLCTCCFSACVCGHNGPLCTCWFSTCVCVCNGPPLYLLVFNLGLCAAGQLPSKQSWLTSLSRSACLLGCPSLLLCS